MASKRFFESVIIRGVSKGKKTIIKTLFKEKLLNYGACEDEYTLSDDVIQKFISTISTIDEFIANLGIDWKFSVHVEKFRGKKSSDLSYGLVMVVMSYHSPSASSTHRINISDNPKSEVVTIQELMDGISVAQSAYMELLEYVPNEYRDSCSLVNTHSKSVPYCIGFGIGEYIKTLYIHKTEQGYYWAIISFGVNNYSFRILNVNDVRDLIRLALQ